METVTFSNQDELNYMFDRYDEIINITMVNLYSLTKARNEIVLTNIDRKNKNHLYLLRIALIAKDAFNFPLKIKTGFWNWLCLNWRMRKLSRKAPRVKEYDDAIDAQRLLDFMYNPIAEHMGHDFKFADIYEAFYRKELD